MAPIKCTENQRALAEASRQVAISNKTDLATKKAHQRQLCSEDSQERTLKTSNHGRTQWIRAQVTASSRNREIRLQSAAHVGLREVTDNSEAGKT